MARYLVLANNVAGGVINGRFPVSATPTGDLVELAESGGIFSSAPPAVHTVDVPGYVRDGDTILSLVAPTPYANIPFAFLEHKVPPGRSVRCIFVSLCRAVCVDE